MMYYVNKLVWLLVSPISISVELFLVALIFELVAIRRKAPSSKASKVSFLLLILSFLWLVFWSMPISGHIISIMAGLDEYKVVADEDIPEADLIDVLGGGTGCERACMGAHLFRLGKAPMLITSGAGSAGPDGEVMVDVGLPSDNLILEGEARNTEENAQYVYALLTRGDSVSKGARKRVLLVTSWYHMKRSILIHRKICPDIEWVPVVTKYGAKDWSIPIGMNFFIPALGHLEKNTAYAKEALGLVGYWLRGFK